MKSFCFLSIVILALLLLPLKASACVCGQQTPCEAFGDSTAVFIGKVMEGSEKVELRHKSDTSEINVAGNVRFAVLETFKGKLADEINLSIKSNINTSCGPYALTQGQTYLIYAYGESGKLSTGVCTRTKSIAGADEDLQFLRNLPAEGSGGKLSGSIWADKGDPETTPLSGVTVIIQNAETQPIKVVTDKEGDFELTGLKAGKYTVRPILPKFYEIEAPTEEVTVSDRGCAGVAFEAKLNGHISGRAFDVNQRPVEMMLILESADPEKKDLHVLGHSYASRNGQFEITGVPPGKYVLYYELQAEDFHNRKQYFYPGVKTQEEATVITIGLGQNLEGLNFQIPAEFVAQSIEGTVVWPDGSPAVGVEVMLLCYKNPQPGGHVLEFGPPADTTDKQGRFNLQGFKGISYWIEARGRQTSPTIKESEGMHSPARQLIVQQDMKDLKLVLSEQGFSGSCGGSLNLKRK